MEIAAQVPGLTPRSILSLSGGVDPAMIGVLETQVEDVDKRRFLMRSPLTDSQALRAPARAPARGQRIRADADKRVRNLREMDLSILPDDALVQTLKSINKLLTQAGDLMLTCASASLASHVALTALLARSMRKSTDVPLEERRASSLARR